MGKSRRGFFGKKSSPQSPSTSLKEEPEAVSRPKHKKAQGQKEPDKKLLTQKARAKQKNENYRSLKKIKKRHVVKQMLQKFPKESVSAAHSGLDDHAASSSKREEEAAAKESNYASRKLLIRQMQGMIAKSTAVDSEYDSWSDLEENFARAYEPIPLDIHMSTWRRMSKADILKTVRSGKMRQDFEALPRNEILLRIEQMQQSAKYLSSKFGVDHLLPQLQVEHVAQVHRSEEEEEEEDGADEGAPSEAASNFSANVPVYLSRSEIVKNYQTKQEAFDEERRRDESVYVHMARAAAEGGAHKHGKKKKKHDSWSSRASSILNNPEAIYVSREEVLKKILKNRMEGSVRDSRRPEHASDGDGDDRAKSDQPTNALNKHIQKRLHDSWSSHASSILARHAVAKAAQGLFTNSNAAAGADKEPKYVSRTELLEKLADLAYDTISETSFSMFDAKMPEHSPRLPPSKTEQESQQQPASPRMLEKADEMFRNEPSHSPLLSRVREDAAGLTSASESYYSDCSVCSCSSCESYTATECSCCNEAYEHFSDDQEKELAPVNGGEEHMYSYMSSNSSAATVIEGGSISHGTARHDVYIVNGSDASHRHSRPGRRSAEHRKVPGSVSSKSSHHSSHRAASMASRDSNSAAAAQENFLMFTNENFVHEPDAENAEKKKRVREQNGANAAPPPGDNEELNKMYEPVEAREVLRQQNERVLRKHLRDIASDWDSRINDLNTLRRSRVLKELKRYLRGAVDLENGHPEEVSRQIGELLRQALDSKFEALSNLNIGQVYVPPYDEIQLENGSSQPARKGPLANPLSSKGLLLAKDNTDYDTFGSIDSLIFEPKLTSQEDIRDVQEEIEHQFQYLDQEDCGEDSQDDLLMSRKSQQLYEGKASPKKLVSGPGKATFAERVKLFQNLGRKKSSVNVGEAADISSNRPPAKKITFLDITGQETSWKTLAPQPEKHFPELPGDHEVQQESLANNSPGREQPDEHHLYSDKDPESFCIYCSRESNYQGSITTNCSICEECAQYGLYDERKQSSLGQPRSFNDMKGKHVTGVSQEAAYNLSSATTTSWNYLNSTRKDHSKEKSGDDDLSAQSSNLSCDSVIMNMPLQPAAQESGGNNLRRQLKEAFGAPAASAGALGVKLTSFAATSRANNGSSPIHGGIRFSAKPESKDELPLEDSFLAEYATRKELITGDQDQPAAVLLRGQTGQAVHLTENMFRGELKGTLTKLQRSEIRPKSNKPTEEELKKKQGSEMGDSGIASPPAAPSLGPLLEGVLQKGTPGSEGESSRSSSSGHDDSGLEEVAAPPPPPGGVPVLPGLGAIPLPGMLTAASPAKGGRPLQGMKKRDTMIRELKSKLKEKFNHSGEEEAATSLSSAESPSLSANGTVTDANAPDQLPIGTVASRKETMGPKLSKLFGSRLLPPKPARLTEPALPEKEASDIPPPLPEKSMKQLTSVNECSVVDGEAAPSSVKKTTFKNIYENRINGGAKNLSCATSISSILSKPAPVSNGSSKEIGSEYESSVYDPSLPEELKRNVPPGVMFRGNRPFTPPAATKQLPPLLPGAKRKPVQGIPHKSHQMNNNVSSDCANPLCQLSNLTSPRELDALNAHELASADPAERREFLYGPGGIFGPKGPFSTPVVRYPHGLELPNCNGPAHTRRSVQFDSKTQQISFSDCSSSAATSAEDRSVKSHYVVNSVLNVEGEKRTNREKDADKAVMASSDASAIPKVVSSRMETYRAEWADRECVASKPSRPLLPEDLERWREEKARRMLAWINGSQLTGYWGSETPWWKGKQRASIRWLLAKAYNHKVPEELVEPFYKDHDDVERLKPHITHSLANAEFYCLALAHLYSDPNFNNLNHWGIIQALARKGVYVAEPGDCALTETNLIQTSPIKISAHMAVTEALMGLFIKELVSIEKVVSVARRLDKTVEIETTPTDQEEALLLWVSRSNLALKNSIDLEIGKESSEGAPTFPDIKELADLSDGVGIAALLALYRPDELKWTEIALGNPPSMADSLYNLRLVSRVCGSTYPSVLHLSLEDVVYLHTSIRLNVIALLADLWRVLEVRPSPGAKLPGVTRSQVIEVPDPGCVERVQQRGYLRGVSPSSSGPIPHLRPSLDTPEPTGLRTDMRVKSPLSHRKPASNPPPPPPGDKATSSSSLAAAKTSSLSLTSDLDEAHDDDSLSRRQ